MAISNIGYQGDPLERFEKWKKELLEKIRKKEISKKDLGDLYKKDKNYYSGCISCGGLGEPPRISEVEENIGFCSLKVIYLEELLKDKKKLKELGLD